ncbi:MAG TPA: MFS transporter [Bacillales bacterium]
MKSPLWTKDYILLGLTNLLIFASFYFLMPTLPLYVVQELNGKESLVGLITGVFTVSSIIVRPWSGQLLDVLGRRKMMLVSLILFSLVTVGYIGTSTIMFLLLIRFLHGAVFGVATTASGTVAADIIPESRRGEGMGYFGIFTIMAMIVGPALGLMIIQQWSYSTMFVTCVGLAILSTIVAAFIKYPEVKNKKRSDLHLSIRYWKEMIELRALPFSITFLSLSVVSGGIVSFVSLYATEVGNADLAGGYFFVYAIGLVAAWFSAGRIYDRFGPNLVVYPGLILNATGLVFLVLASGAPLFYTAAILIGLGFGSIQPSVQAMVINAVSENRRGAATATFYMALDIGIGAGSFFLGLVAQWIGYRGMFLSCLLFIATSALLYKWAQGVEIGRIKENRKTINSPNE